jgi:hypothetical protein
MNVDTSGIIVLEELHKRLLSRGIKVRLSRDSVNITVNSYIYIIYNLIIKRVCYFHFYFAVCYGESKVASNSQA